MESNGFMAKYKTQLGLGLLGIIVIAVVVVVPVVLATTGESSSKKDDTLITDFIPPKEPFDLSKITMEERNRINCFLEQESRFENLTRYQCEEVRSCTFRPSKYERVPDCFFKRDVLGYELDGNPSIDANTESYKLKRSSKGNATYLEVIENLKLSVEYLGNNVVHVKIEDDNDPDRYQIPYKINQPPLIDNKVNSKAKFSYSIDSNKLFQFKILRASDNEAIFDTNIGAFLYHNQFIQIATKLPSQYVYGFGENNHEELLHDLNFRSWGMFARDFGPGWGRNRNLYGFQPVYYGIENSGKSHLVLLYNSNAMEYIFSPAPSLTLRTIGGILDFYFVVDDVPETIFQTYHSLIGKPLFPPYWSLGFQMSRWGYKKLDDVKKVVDRNRAISIPQDVQYVDIEYMIGFRILTVNPLNFSGLSTYQQDLEKIGIRLVLIQDPGLVVERNNSYYMNGISKRDGGIYIKWPKNMAPYDKDALNKDDMISWCWPNGKLSYPDYLYEETHTWWEESIRNFIADGQKGTGCDVAGIWIDMNEPSSFETNEPKPWNWLWPEDDQDRYPYFSLKCPVNKYDDPPYRTKNAFAFDGDDVLIKKARLSQKTLCMIATQRHAGKEYLHYDVHNLYGHSQSIATFNALKNIKNTRPFSLTRSNFVGTGHYAAHWLGDNEAKWEHMRMSIIGAIEYNIFGFAMVGADLCGFGISIQDAEMCTRWLQLGAFHTFARNHNSNNNLDKDPAAFNNKTLEDSTRDVLRIRYTILPYIYTLLYNTHRYGGTAIKALFFEFPMDKQTYAIDEQFLLGKSLMVSPVVYPGKTSVNAYIPNSKWYDYRTGSEETARGWVVMNVPLSYIPLHLRGGSILPIQEPRDCLNTMCTRGNPLGVIVSLDENKNANGDFYWDDGDTIIDYDNVGANNFFYARFKFENQILTMAIEKNYPGMANVKLDDVWIYGLDVSNPSVQISGSNLDTTKFTYNSQTKVLKMNRLDITITNGFNIEIKSLRFKSKSVLNHNL